MDFCVWSRSWNESQSDTQGELCRWQSRDLVGVSALTPLCSHSHIIQLLWTTFKSCVKWGACMRLCVCVCLYVLCRFCHVWLFATLWTNPPCSSVHEILQARILERVVMLSRGWTWVSCVSCIAGRFFYHWATEMKPIKWRGCAKLSLKCFPSSNWLLYSHFV